MWIVFAGVMILFLLSKIGENAEVQNLKYVEIIKTTDLYKTGYEHSGFSIGKSGTRSYYRRRKRYVGTDIKFRVTYNTGKTATITAREGTKKCQILFDFIDEQDRAKAKRPIMHKHLPLDQRKRRKRILLQRQKNNWLLHFLLLQKVRRKQVYLSLKQRRLRPKLSPQRNKKFMLPGNIRSELQSLLASMYSILPIKTVAIMR